MKRVRVTVTKDGETITDKECDAVILGLVANDETETIATSPGVSLIQLAMLVTSLLKNIEEIQDDHPALTEAVLRLNEMSDLEDAEK